MNRHVSLNKQTKKRQKAHHAVQWNTWNAVRPVTRIVAEVSIKYAKSGNQIRYNAVSRILNCSAQTAL